MRNLSITYNKMTKELHYLPVTLGNLYRWTLVLVCVLAVLPVSAQQNPVDFSVLTHSNSQLAAYSTDVEAALDLVQVASLDDRLDDRFIPHQSFFGGRFLKWKKMYPQKEKFIGTASMETHLYHNPIIRKEYDVCFFLVPHLDLYIDIAKLGIDHMVGEPKPGPYLPCLDCPEPLIVEDGGGMQRCIYVECECSPPAEHLDQLFTDFFPCTETGSDEDHTCSKSDSLPVGVYGAYVSDCLHQCKPEVHPYDWIWWLNTGVPEETQKEWMIGFFGDRSGRFSKWVKPPRQGTIALPFAFPDSADLKIELDTRVLDTFHPLAASLRPTAESGIDVYSGAGTHRMQVASGNLINLEIKGLEAISSAYWISEIKQEEGWVTGYFNLAIGVESLYTASVSMDY